MSLNERQQDDLNKSILAYLKARDHSASHKALVKELNIDEVDPKYDGLLEKKWSSVIRLQKKIMDLEQQLAELRESIPLHLAQTNGKIDLKKWTPRAPARHILTGHKQPITSVAFHPVFNVVASGSEDSTVKIWDWENGDFERTLKGHNKAVTCVDFAKDVRTDRDGKQANYLASGSNDMTIRLWDSNDEYKCVKTMHGHEHVVSAIKFLNPASDTLISTSRDCSIRLWSLDNGYCTRTIHDAHTEWTRCLSLSSDNTFVVTAGSDQIAKIFDLESGQEKLDFRGHDHVIECITYAPPSSHPYLSKISNIPITKLTSYFATGSRDRTIKIWNAQSGLCIATLTGHENWIRSLVFHPDGQFLISVGDDKALKVWDLEQGARCSRTIHDAHSHFIASVGFNTNKRYVVATGGIDQTIRIWTP